MTTRLPQVRVRRHHQRRKSPTKPERPTRERDRVPLAAITASDDGDLYMEDGESEPIKLKERDEE